MDTAVVVRLQCIYHKLWHETLKGLDIFIEATIEFADGVYRAIYIRNGRRKAFLASSLDFALSVFPAKYRRKIEELLESIQQRAAASMANNTEPEEKAIYKINRVDTDGRRKHSRTVRIAGITLEWLTHKEASEMLIILNENAWRIKTPAETGYYTICRIAANNKKQKSRSAV